jgi:outer membrane protein assembly factor BamB
MVIGSGKTGTVVALDPDTGELLWRTSVGRHDNDDLEALPVDPVTIYPGVFGGVLTPTAYAEGIVYVPVVNLPFGFSSAGLLPATGDINGALVALDVRNGTPLWTANLPAPCYGAATVINDLVLTSDAEGHVYAFDRTHGTQVWTYDAPTGINAPLAATDDLLLIPAGMTANGPALIALGL